jgi:flagellar biosynthetic protein FlhB
VAEERTDERTEPATPRRREEARERGHVARSSDLSSAVVLLAAVLALEFLGRPLTGGIFSAAAGVLGGLGRLDGDGGNLFLACGSLFSAALLGFAPFLLIVVAAALGANLLQVGFLFTGHPLVPRLERLDPVEGLARIFSVRSLARLLAGILKVGAVGAVVALTIWSERRRLTGLSGLSFEQELGAATGLVWVLSLRAALVLLVLAILEYGYQRWQYERDLRMSRQEVREELKRFEGDPRIRERRRAIQRRLAMQRMMQRVPEATVVVTNPTHLAVALEYAPERMEAPVVAAKGAELMARRIREVALEHGVPIVERRELAQALYRSAEVGQAVPAELYQAAAEVLAYVYRLRGMAPAA